MVGADIRSTHHARLAGVAERVQLAEQPVSAASSEISAVLKSEPARAAISDKADGFEVEARPFALDPFAAGVGAADILARRAADDDVGKDAKVGNKSSCRESTDVVVDADMRIVLCVKDAPPLDDFAGGNGEKTGAVQAERPAARGGAEQVEGAHHGAPRRAAPAPWLACARVKEKELVTLLDSSIKCAARFAPNVPILFAPNLPIGFTWLSQALWISFRGENAAIRAGPPTRFRAGIRATAGGQRCGAGRARNRTAVRDCRTFREGG